VAPSASSLWADGLVSATQASLSVIIPTFNEAKRIGACLAGLPHADVEVIVSDGGSCDGTAEVAARAGAVVVSGARGRARQMNAGAAVAGGRLLAFLHADTTPKVEAWARLGALANCEVALWGRFDVRLSGPGVAFRVVERMMNARSRLTGVATGDQFMFVSAALFREIGGFPDIALMEDVALSVALRQRRPALCLRERVETSSRKWRREGVVSTVLLMWRLRLAYALGVDPSILARRYYGRRAEPPP